MKNDEIKYKYENDSELWNDIIEQIDDIWFKITPWHWLYRLPHNLFQDWPREVKWAWQRVFTGYDERVVWGPYDYLGRIILTHLKNFKKSERHGYPAGLYENNDTEGENRWEKVLDDMIEGWEFIVDEYKFNDEIKEKYGDPRDSEETFMGVKIDSKKWNSKCSEEYNKLWEEKHKKAELFTRHFSSLWD